MHVLPGFFIGLATEAGKPWDHCAGYVIAAEAGAVFLRLDSRTYLAAEDPSAEEFDIYSRSCVVAATPELAAYVKQVLKP